MSSSAGRVVFVRPRVWYESYQDFWNLVSGAGFSTCHPDEVDPHEPGRAYICSPLNGEYGPEPWPAKRASKMIHWNLERGPSTLRPDPRFDEEWRSDLAWATDGAAYGKCRFVQVGYDPYVVGTRGAAAWRDRQEKWTHEFVHLSYMSPRRQYIIPTIEQAGHTMVAGGWGEERDAALRGAKYMLSIHQDEHPHIEPLRYSLAASYGLDIVTEASIRDPSPWEVCRKLFTIPSQDGPEPITLLHLRETPQLRTFKVAVLEALR